MVTNAKTVLVGVRVFDGERLSRPRTVVIDGSMIGANDDTAGAGTVDAGGAVLLPGLIDAHVHLADRGTLEALASRGVTTALDMACWPVARVTSLRGVPGLTDIRSAGVPAIGPHGPHAHFPDMPPDAIVLSAQQAQAFVTARVAEGSDYIKIVLEDPGNGGPTQDVADALVTQAHAAGKKVVAHAAARGAYEMALHSGADVITHIPLGSHLSAEHAAAMARAGMIAVPTLTIAEGKAHKLGQPDLYLRARPTIAILSEAGVPVLAGTDAHTQAGPLDPAPVSHGDSLHHELELLVDAGMSPAQALRAATSNTARHFGLTDRGAVEPGLRADLVLLEGDPLADIRATRRITRIWCAGIEVTPASM